MNVSPTNQRLISSQTTPVMPGSQHGPAPAQTSTTESPGSQVAISAASRKLFELQQQDDPHADVDMARVQALRAAIAAGELPVDAGRIADGLIGSACELLQPKV